MHGDTSEGTFEQVFNRTYNLAECKYLGLNEFLVPELVDADITNKLVLTGRPGVKGTIDLLKHIEKTDDFTKTIRRQFVTSHMKTHKILLKYPLLSNPAPSWHADYISCERKNLKKQTISLYFNCIKGLMFFIKVIRKVKNL